MTEADTKIKKHRNRKKRSCTECHRRKTKCDLNFPCESCAKKNVPCSFQYKALPGPAVKEVLSVPLTSPPLSDNGATPPKVGIEFTPANWGPSQSIKQAGWPFSYSDNVDSHQTNDSSTNGGSSVESSTVSTTPACRPAATMSSLLSRISVLNETFATDEARLLRFVPERSVSDKLLERYLCSVHPVIPIIDWSKLWYQYELFWQTNQSADLPFLLIFFSVCYASSVAAYEEAKLVQPDPDTKYINELSDHILNFVTAAELALSMCHFPRKPSLVGCQAAFLLFAVCRSDCRTDDSAGLAALIRCSQLMGLHQNSLVSCHEDAQIRKMLWWQIVYLDVMTALSSGLAPLIHPDLFDTSTPDEYVQRGPSSYTVSHANLFANGRFLWASVTAEILREFHKLPKKPISQQTANSLNNSIKQLGLSLNSKIIRMTDSSNTNSGLSIFINWAVSMLSSLEKRAQILLYREVCMGRDSNNDTPSPSSVSDSGYSSSSRTGSMSVSTGSVDPKPNLPSPSDSPPKTNPNLISNTSSLADTSTTICYRPHLITAALSFLNEFCQYGDSAEYSLLVWETRKFQPLQAMLIILHELSRDAADQLDNIASSTLDIDKDSKVLCINKCFDKLSYLGEHTTALCMERWKDVLEIKNSIWQQVYLVDQFRRLSQDPHSTGGQSVDNHQLDTNYIRSEVLQSQHLIEQSLNLQVWDPVAGHYVW